MCEKYQFAKKALSSAQMNAIQIEEVVILNFIKEIAKLKIGWTITKRHVVNVFVKLVIVR